MSLVLSVGKLSLYECTRNPPRLVSKPDTFYGEGHPPEGVSMKDGKTLQDLDVPRPGFLGECGTKGALL